MIEEAGCDVVEAGNADEAIAILGERYPHRFHRHRRAGINGWLKLARAIRDRWPPIELIFPSGRYRLGASDIPARSHFLLPYNLDVIVEVLGGFVG